MESREMASHKIDINSIGDNNISIFNSRIIANLIREIFPDTSKLKIYENDENNEVVFSNELGFIRFTCNIRGRIAYMGRKADIDKISTESFDEKPDNEVLIKLIEILK